MIQKYFNKKWVVLSGGSSGIGLAVAQQLAELGANLTLIARKKEPLEQAIAALKPANSDQRFIAISADISDRDKLYAALNQHSDVFSADIVINNAGISITNEFTSASEDEFITSMNINYFGALWLTRYYTNPLIKKGGGHIAFVSSIAGLLGAYGYGAYSSSKFALTGLAQTLRGELKQHNIKVSTIFPPDVATPMYDNEIKTRPEITNQLANKNPLTAPYVANALLRGMAKGQAEIFPGTAARLMGLGIRTLPRITNFFVDRVVSNASK